MNLKTTKQLKRYNKGHLIDYISELEEENKAIADARDEYVGISNGLGKIIKQYKPKEPNYKMLLVLTMILIVTAATVIIYPVQNKTIPQEQIDEIIEENKKDYNTKTIYDRCSLEQGLENQTLCAANFVKQNYKYKESDLIYTSDELFETGGDCKSYTILYLTLADMLGYDYAYIKTKTHVFAMIYSDSGYCIADQDKLFCLDY